MRGGPGPLELSAAREGSLRDVLADDLEVLFVGINPSLYSAAVGHHYARPGNRFWPALHRCGLTPARLHARDDGQLPRFGAGLTNLAARPTAKASELRAEELVAGAAILCELVGRIRPRMVAVVGVTAFRQAFDSPRASIGRQTSGIAGAGVWVLPNPSGLNAHFQLPALAQLYGRMLSEARRRMPRCARRHRGAHLGGGSSRSIATGAR